jgi:hypothetical protein
MLKLEIETEFVGCGFEHAHGFGGDFRPDTVAVEDHDFRAH